MSFDRLHKLNQVLWQTLSESEGLQLACESNHESEWENAVGILIDEIIQGMTDGKVEPWTREDELKFQRTLAEQQLGAMQQKIARIDEELSKNA